MNIMLLPFYKKTLFLTLLCITTPISAMLQISKKVSQQIPLKYPSRKSQIALLEAVKKNNEADVIRFIRNGISVNTRYDDDNNALLHVATYNEYKNLVKILLKNGAAVNIQNNDGITPLSCALVNKHIPCIELLLQYGASQTIQNINGYTPIHWLFKDADDYVKDITTEERKKILKIISILLCDRLEKLNELKIFT